MKIEESYLAVSGFFELWVRLMEIRTRIMAVQDSRVSNLKILIISPPTDGGIKLLTQANQRGESHLLCFSEALGEIAKQYAIQYNIEGLKIFVEPFFSIPFEDNHFDAVFTNCFFDFCQKRDFNDILKEIKRTLKSKGCHPVDIIPFLSNWSFKLKKDLTIRRLGFPVKYIIAEG